MKYKFCKGLAVGIVCLLMLVTFPTIVGNEDIEYPKENGPYLVFIGGKSYGGVISGPINFEWLLILEEGYTRVI